MTKVQKKSSVFIALYICFFLPSFISADELSLLQKQARIYRTQGLELQKQGRMEAAIIYYQKAIKLDPNYVAAYNDLGIIYEVKGWPDRAEEIYLAALRIDPNYLNIYSNLAMFYEQKKDFARAVSFWKKRIELGAADDPWVEKAKQRLRVLVQFEPELQEEFLRQEAAKLSKDIESKKKIERLGELAEVEKLTRDAKTAFESEDYEKSLSSINLALIVFPQDKALLAFQDKISLKIKERARRLKEQERQSRFDEAKALYKNENYQKAIDSVNLALTVFPQDKELLMFREKISDSIKERAEMLRAKERQSRFDEAKVLYKDENYQKALDSVNLALTIFPQDKELLAFREKISDSIKERGEMLRAEERQGRIDEAKALYQDKNYEKALDSVNISLTAFPNDEELFALRNRIYAKIEEQKLRLKEEQKKDYFVVTEEAFQNGEYEKALNSVNVALIVFPQDVELIDFRKKIKNRIYNKLEEQELKLKEEEKRTYFREAKELFQNGEYEKALNSINVILNTFPDDKELISFKDRIKNRLYNKLEEEELRIKQEERITYFSEAKKLFQTGEYEQALNSVNIALTSFPQDEELLSFKDRITSRIYAKLEEEERRVREEERKLRFDEVKRLYENAEYEKALYSLNLAIFMDPESKNILAELKNEIADKLEEKQRKARIVEMQTYFQNIVNYYEQDNLQEAERELDKIATIVTSSQKDN
ncbi:MAG: tetratricopeptide repeat protein [Candidatus Omnitrophota bacterium]